MKYCVQFLLLFFCISSFIAAQPVPVYDGVTINQLGTVSSNTLRIKQDPTNNNLYTLQTNGEIKRVNFNGDSSSVTFTTVYQQSNHGLIGTLGMAFGPDGTLYVVGNASNSQTGMSVGTVAKGIPDSPGSETRTWSVLAQTVEYNYGAAYNHRMSGIIVDPDNDYVYVNSGARTDHGEEREGGLREIPLTSLIFKLPVNGDNIALENDWDWLVSNDYVLADGIRNTFDFAYSGNGDLFGVENAGDRDDLEELNWIREGHHYGFPWRIGGNNTPQQYSPYNPKTDPLLNPNAWGGGQGQLYITFSDDPDFPPAPDSITFTEPVMNSGPHGDKFRDTTTGNVMDASQLGTTISTFTPHRSVNGIAFDRDSLLLDEFKGGGFVISLAAGNTFQPFADTSQDLLHLSLTKLDDTAYISVTTRIVRGFNAPLGIEFAGGKIYVVETGLWFPSNPNPGLYEINLPSGTVDAPADENIINRFRLYQNYPNPFNPETKIIYNISKATEVNFIIYDMLGSEVMKINQGYKYPGNYELKINASNLSSGVYFYKIEAGSFISVRKMILMK